MVLAGMEKGLATTLLSRLVPCRLIVLGYFVSFSPTASYLHTPTALGAGSQRDPRGLPRPSQNEGSLRFCLPVAFFPKSPDLGSWGTMDGDEAEAEGKGETGVS